MRLTTLIILVTVLSLATVHCARILEMFPIFAKSHHLMFQPIMDTLAQAGHQVVVYSPFPRNNPPPNYTDIFLENISVDSEERREFFKEIATYPYWKSLDCSWHSTYELLFHEFIEDKAIKQLLTSREKFDLIMVETIGQEFNLILGHILNAPVISLQAFYTNNLANSYSGNSYSTSFIPDLGSPFSDEMTFFERLYNTLSSLRGLFIYYNFRLPRIDTIMREKFSDMPPLLDMTNNLSLIFTNDHLSADYPLPRPPNLIPVAGIHIGIPDALPKDIQRFMDGAAHGVVFFSLGTYVQDEIKPKEYFEMYKSVFKKLKQRVLWKTRKENIEGLPSNVMTLKWAPQKSILAHPNCVLFITHGGLFSQHEAVHFGVPVIGIPQFFDQHRNVKYYEAHGVGVKVDNRDISEKTMSDSIHEVLDNPRYRENMKKLSAIFKDRPLSPAESVVFWTEYVLRHGGAAHLRPASTELRWYQLILLDVFTLLLAVISTFLILGYCSIRYCVKVFFSSRRKQMDVERKNK